MPTLGRPTMAKKADRSAAISSCFTRSPSMGAPPLCYSLRCPRFGADSHRGAPTGALPVIFSTGVPDGPAAPGGPQQDKGQGRPQGQHESQQREGAGEDAPRRLPQLPPQKDHEPRRGRPHSAQEHRPRRRVLYHADHQAVGASGRSRRASPRRYSWPRPPVTRAMASTKAAHSPRVRGSWQPKKHHIAARRQVDAHVPLALHAVPDAPQGVPEAVEQPAPAAGGLPVRHPGRSCCWPAGPAPA